MGTVVDLSNLANIGTILGGIFGATAFFWKVFDFIVSQRGFMVPKLECRSEGYNNKCYIIAKTSLENTSRRPIYINNAYLLLVSSSIEHDDSIKKLSMDVHIKELGDKRISPEIYTKLYETCINNQCKEIRKKDGDITIIFKILPYYTSLHSRLGGFALLSSGIVSEVQKHGIWSIYFGVIGKDWYRKVLRRRSDFRIAHDELIV